jgi:hypothetical protein
MIFLRAESAADGSDRLVGFFRRRLNEDPYRPDLLLVHVDMMAGLHGDRAIFGKSRSGSVAISHQDHSTGSAFPELGVERELAGCALRRFPVRLVVEVWGELLEPDCLALVWSEPAKRSRTVGDRDLGVGVADKSECFAPG